MARLDEFMDRYAPPRGIDPAYDRYYQGGQSRRRAPLAEAGPASQRIARAARRPEMAELALASLFWWCYVQTDDFRLDTRHIGEQGQRQIVVRHGDEAYDLLVLTPDAAEAYGVRIGSQDVSHAITLDPPGQGLRSDRGLLSAVALREGGRMRGMLARAGIDMDVRSVVIAVREVAERGYFQMVIAPQPPETLTQAVATARSPQASFVAPVPALAVTLPGVPRPVATAGIIGSNVTGDLLAVTARHALDTVADKDEVFVGGAPARIIRTNGLTDSCLLSVSCRAGVGAGHAGPLLFPPAEHRPAIFDGAASGHKQTMIRAYDRSVLDTSLYLSSKIYTDPDTIPGDSGAALIDSDDHIVGFAVSRTPLGAPLEFSTWAWAAQVLTAHGLA